ncbi:MAG: sugar ABC transporter ATP-binding protein, partial [Oscillospiraceae bacterium]|nr:sugar ABC transporter ATP-binding protein [Oscillospiraceae bacterium]
MAEYEYEVEMRGISKSFAGVKALQNVDFCIKHGEIHALMGENGAGKSTLIRCLSGVGPADSGTIKLRGKEVKIANPKDGIQNGISVIYQEFALVQHLTVAENILLDDFREGSAFVNWKKMREKAKAALDDLGFSQIDVNTKVADLSVAYQQVVEICKALIRNASVLVLDEPTAVMTNAEVEQLFVLIDRLKKRGVSIVYVSHRLDEIFRISDRITVLKDGEYVDTVNTADIDSSRLVAMMIGRDLATFFPPRVADIGDVVLRAEHLSAGHAVKDISFEVRAGEVLGLAGLVGAGRTEAIRAMLGVDRLDSGKVYLNDKEIHLRSTKDAYAHGIGFLPE